MLDTASLDIAVAAPDNAGLSDADFLAKINTLNQVPKTTKMTIVTLASSLTGWGRARANAFWDWLEVAQAAGNKDARLALVALGSSGIDPSDPESLQAAAEFVAAGGCTQEEVNKVFYDSSYPCGDIVQAADLTASRSRVALVSTCNQHRDWLRQKFTQAMGAVDTAQRNGAATTKTALQAIFDPNT